MMGLVDRALALNPSFARGWTISGLLRLFAGQSERAIEHAETALRLSPRAAARERIVHFCTEQHLDRQQVLGRRVAA